ncbi:MAG: hypothetical protein M3463_10375 [Verrucomicrobiota bacterium]|nr:hypothetical protein [Verrucomicrobiota bacterium]
MRWRDDLKLASDEEKTRFAGEQAKWEAATADIRAQIDAIIGPMIEKNVQQAYRRFTEEIRRLHSRAINSA